MNITVEAINLPEWVVDPSVSRFSNWGVFFYWGPYAQYSTDLPEGTPSRSMSVKKGQVLTMSVDVEGEAWYGGLSTNADGNGVVRQETWGEILLLPEHYYILDFANRTLTDTQPVIKASMGWLAIPIGIAILTGLVIVGKKKRGTV